MQLKAPIRPALAWVLAASMLSAAPADAEVEMGSTTTVFREQGGPLHMTVISPSARGRVGIGDSVSVQAGWSADVVTGASVAVVDAPSADIDTITSATRLTDTRHTFQGGLGLHGEVTSLELAYSYGFENDYRSHAFRLAASAELFERNTRFEIAYGRAFDQVCNLAQPRSQEAVDRRRMPDAEGCFGGDDREAMDLAIQTVQGTWTQAWLPVLVTQLTLTTQLLHGYQANPYRAIWLGRVAAQEHHPENRARYAGGLGLRWWVTPFKGAIQLFGRVYRDTWGIESLTGEAAYEQTIVGSLRVRGRARYYTQTGAAFFSDDYTLAPRGRYFTGDRELSPMSSWTLGGRVAWSIPTGPDGNVLGFLGALDLVGKADVILMNFPQFHYGNVPVPNDRAVMVTVGVEAKR